MRRISRGDTIAEECRSYWSVGVSPATSRAAPAACGSALAYPVEEITVAGNLKDAIPEISNDPEFRSSIACPMLRIDGLTIAVE